MGNRTLNLKKIWSLIQFITYKNLKNVIISKITYLNTLPSGGGEGRVLLVFVLGTSLRGEYGANDGSDVEVDDVDCWHKNGYKRNQHTCTYINLMLTFYCGFTLKEFLFLTLTPEEECSAFLPQSVSAIEVWASCQTFSRLLKTWVAKHF